MAGTGKFGLDPESPVYYRALVNRYRHRLRVGPTRKSAAEIPPGAVEAELHRVKTSHKGVGAMTQLTGLAAAATDQDFLDEIGALTGLVHLDLRFPMRAPDLSPLRNLRKLRVLRMDSPSRVEDFTPILDLPELEVLLIENAQHLFDLDWMRPLKDRLFVLGLEGSIMKDQRIASLAPLEGFAFEALFMISATVKDRDLSPLATCPNLYLLDCARLAPKAQFQALEAKRPEIICTWFNWDVWEGMRRKRS